MNDSCTQQARARAKEHKSEKERRMIRARHSGHLGHGWVIV